MALFGKKKKAEQPAPQPNPEDEIQVVGGDADETDFDNDDGGQVIDFDAIADDLNETGEGSELGDELDDTNGDSAATVPATVPDEDAFDLSGADDDMSAFATTSGFETTGASGNAGLNADDELDFDAVFDDGSNTAATPVVDSTTTADNPFDNALDSGIDIEPVAPVAANSTVNAPPLTHTAPLTTTDIVASGNAPAVRRSLPLLPLLGAAGLLVALGVVGWTVFGPKNDAEDTVVATTPAMQTEATPGEMAPDEPPGAVAAPGAPSNGVNPGIAVDGVPIAPGPVVRTAPLNSGPRPTVPLTPTLQKQLKDLWNKGAAAKRAQDFAGARAAWTQMLQLRPNHPGIQEAIDKLPAG